jgi:hypothetical protein
MTSARQTLFTMTYDGEPVALVRAADFAAACKIAEGMLEASGEGADASDPDGLRAAFTIDRKKLRARAPTDAERFLFAQHDQAASGSDAILSGIPIEKGSL